MCENILIHFQLHFDLFQVISAKDGLRSSNDVTILNNLHWTEIPWKYNYSFTVLLESNSKVDLHHWLIEAEWRIYASAKLAIIRSEYGSSLGRRQGIIWASDEILLNGPLATNFSDILMEIYIFCIP